MRKEIKLKMHKGSNNNVRRMDIDDGRVVLFIEKHKLDNESYYTAHTVVFPSSQEIFSPIMDMCFLEFFDTLKEAREFLQNRVEYYIERGVI